MLTPYIIVNPKYWLEARTARWRVAQRLAPGVLGALTWHKNFYHWLIEILPRLRMLDEGHVDPTLPIYMPESSPSFVKQSLQLVGLDRRVRWLPDAVYDTEGLIVPSRLSLSWYPTAVAIDWLRHRILGDSRVGASSSTSRRLYISRRDVADRMPVNDQEVESAMASLGFEIVNFSKMDLAAQIRLTSGARLMVGAHGAGLAHTAFLPEGAGVIELLEEGRGQVQGGFHYVASLSNALYGLMVCPRGFAVDVPRLIRFVKRMLETVECSQPLVDQKRDQAN